LPTEDVLLKDMEFVSEGSNPTVKTLATLRDKFFAHRDSREVMRATDLFASYPITNNQVT
jgi:hypothetical protein